MMASYGARLHALARSASVRFHNLGLYGKAVLLFLVLFNVCLIVLIALVTPSRIAQFMYDLSVVLRRLPYGYFILIVVIVLTSFPPFIGYTTLINLCGFTYGMRGFIPAAISTVGGSAIAFVVLRALFSGRLRKWSATNEKWRALEAVIRAKGLPLIILIRISSFPPWVYSNSLFASIESVSLSQFVFATLFVLPRAMVYVFIGSRIASLSDGEQRSHMDATTKILNGSLIVGGIVISVIASSVVFYFVRKEVALLQSNRLATADQPTPEAPEEESPLLADSSIE